MQIALNVRCERMRAAKYAPRGRFDLLERRHGLTEIVERGVGVVCYRPLARRRPFTTGLYGSTRVDAIILNDFCQNAVPQNV